MAEDFGGRWGEHEGGLLVGAEEGEDEAVEGRVVGGERIEGGGALLGGERGDAMEGGLGALEEVRGHGGASGVLSMVWRRARANRHSRSTEERERSRAAAVSSAVRPAK